MSKINHKSTEKSNIQLDIIKEYFEMNPDVEISTKDAVDWVISTYRERTGKIFRDPDRGIRSLYQKGFLQKIAKGVYKYDPKYAINKRQEDFTSAQKNEILKRDGYKCVICGLGRENGAELHVDHIKPKDIGGLATIENGQTLCSQHNFLKKNLKQTETGKKMFIRLYELSKREENQELQAFCLEILQTFENFNINGHIEWER
ncbi:HNH endonuclease [Pseudanabaena sp. 'Roaring Creek']|uniref:HNH endonuclease n=1 Tax=Pseudanabaena sp. 'Roaring Creek' TaxID=1681830 RepID=UPI0006D822A0|nr:HNH endonuclease signature motif containing protein [Pseudanabaena sp. 'Roaring Creek']